MNIKATALIGLSLHLFIAANALTATSPRLGPKPIATPSPVYPEALADTGTSGQAVIEILVKTDGSPGETRVKSTDHEAFAKAAMDVVPQWRFEPGTQDGTPVEMRVAVPFHFVPPVPQQINALFKRKVYQVLPEPAITQKEFGKKPKPLKPIRPVYSKALASAKVEGKVTVRFVIAPDGTTLNPEPTGKPKKELVLPALAAISKATFAPPVKDGKAVYVETSHTLNFAPPEPRKKRGGGGGGGGGFGDGGGGGFGGGGGGDGGGGGID